MALNWRNLFPPYRLQPDEQTAKNIERLYSGIPDELIDVWVEQILLSNPQSTDANVVIAWAARCDFVESIIKIRDRVANPQKYERMRQPPRVGPFDARKVA